MWLLCGWLQARPDLVRFDALHWALKRPAPPKIEADRGHAESLALIAAGKTAEKREKLADALRCYQRRLRLDPKSTTLVASIIPLAVRLHRYDEAVRYALTADALDGVDPLLLRQLCVCLVGEGDYANATALYQKVMAVRGNAKKTASDILMRMEMGRLCQLTGKFKQAAACFADVIQALDHPRQFGLDAPLKQSLLDDPGPTYQLMGDCFLAADRPEDAQAAFEKADQLSSDKAMRQFNLARVDLKSGKPAEALAALESAFAENLAGQGAAPYETLAQSLDKLGRSKELIGRLEKLYAADPGNLPLRHFLADRVSSRRQARQGRVAVSRTVHDPPDTRHQPGPRVHLSADQAL